MTRIVEKISVPSSDGSVRLASKCLACLFLGVAALGCVGARADAAVCNVPQVAGGPPSPASGMAQPSRIQPPSPGEYYHGVYPGGRNGFEDDATLADLVAYQEAVWRRVAWVYFSHNWSGSYSAAPAFPFETASWIRSTGAVPFVRLMLTRDPEAQNHLQSILDGTFDADLEAWGACAREFRSALLVEWGTEMNGCWFPWSGCRNGADGAAVGRFAAAYRHIVDRVRGAGAQNVTWVFHVNSADDPDEGAPWNDFEHYYPGDDYVDWVGLSHYGPQACCDKNWNGWADGLKGALKRLKESDASEKPVFLLEFGVDGNNSRGAADGWTATSWTDRALDFLLAKSSEHHLSGFAWWNERFNDLDCKPCITDMRVQSVPGLAEVFRDYLIGDDRVLDRPILEPLKEKP